MEFNVTDRTEVALNEGTENLQHTARARGIVISTRRSPCGTSSSGIFVATQNDDSLSIGI